MPRRILPFIENTFYHVYNKSLDHLPVFNQIPSQKHFLNILRYYRSSYATRRYSRFLSLEPQIKITEESRISDSNSFLFQCLAYSFMPNHFHLLLHQIGSLSISKCLQKCLIAFTRTFNKLNNREGPVFLSQFKSVLIESEEQLRHVSRYIHLNPYSSGLIKNLEELSTSSLTSLPFYLTKTKSDFCETSYLLGLFYRNRSKYKDFVFSHAQHQRNLEKTKHNLSL